FVHPGACEYRLEEAPAEHLRVRFRVCRGKLEDPLQTADHRFHSKIFRLSILGNGSRIRSFVIDARDATRLQLRADVSDRSIADLRELIAPVVRHQRVAQIEEDRRGQATTRGLRRRSRAPEAWTSPRVEARERRDLPRPGARSAARGSHAVATSIVSRALARTYHIR